MSSHRRDRGSYDRAERRRDRSDSPNTRRRSSSRMDDLDQYQEKQIRPRDDTRRDRHQSERRRSSHKDDRHRSDRHRDDKSRKRSKRDKGTPSDDEDLLDLRALGISPITEEDY
jgi:hypothetical protein